MFIFNPSFFFKVFYPIWGTSNWNKLFVKREKEPIHSVEMKWRYGLSRYSCRTATFRNVRKLIFQNDDFSLLKQMLLLNRSCRCRNVNTKMCITKNGIWDDQVKDVWLMTDTVSYFILLLLMCLTVLCLSYFIINDNRIWLSIILRLCYYCFY